MIPLTEFEQLQYLHRKRQLNYVSLFVWLAVFCCFLLLAYTHSEYNFLLFPAQIISAVMISKKLLQLYYAHSQASVDEKPINRQMELLFGVDWRDKTDFPEYAFARERVQEHRVNRWMTLIIIVLFMPLGISAALGILSLMFSQQTCPAILLGIPFLATIYVILPRIWDLFFMRGNMIEAEREVGLAFQLEIANTRAGKLKQVTEPKRIIDFLDQTSERQKPKRGTYYVGDEGELIELSDLDEAKQKPNEI